MMNEPEEKLFTMRELIVITVIFSIYAWSLLQLDPEWVMWMGFTTLGTTPPPALPPPFSPMCGRHFRSPLFSALWVSLLSCCSS